MDTQSDSRTPEDLTPGDSSAFDRSVAWFRHRWREAAISEPRTSGGGLGRKVLVTFGLLLLWQAAHFIPLPVLNPEALGDWASMHQGALARTLSWAWPQTSVVALGYGPYLLAHLILLWLVLCVPRLRKMGFVYRRNLDYHVVALTFLIGLLEGIGRLAWCSNMVSPTGRKFVSSYFLAHPASFRIVGLCALLTGLAFTLLILRIIRRHGVPFPLTCMVVWSLLFSVARELLSAYPEAVRTEDPKGILRGAIILGVGLVGALGSLGAFWLYTDRGPSSSDGGSRTQSALFGRIVTGEPSFLIFGLLSSGVFMWLWRLSLRVLPLLGESGRTVAGALVLPDVGDGWERWALRSGTALGLALVSSLVFHRLFYNPDLRGQLGGQLPSPVHSFHGACWRALGIWCLFCGLVAVGEFLRLEFFPSYPLLRSLATPLPWEVVFLLVATVGFALYARNLRLGFVAPVYAHGYYEPLYAVKSFLEENGIPSVFGGEPYALLHGIIVGPVGRKELLVRESDRGRALELLDAAGVTKRRSVAATGEAPEGPAPEPPSPA